MELNNPAYYFNRELSWLAFNERVLEEALDKGNPLLERMKFLAITASNLDEFFMVRVSGLMEQEAYEFNGKDPAGLSAGEQLAAISRKVHQFVTRQYNCLNRSLLPTLEKENVFFPKMSKLSREQKEYVKSYFYGTLFPILTPQAIDQSRPFPLLNNKSLNFIVELEDDAEILFAVIQVPTVIPRLISLPAEDGRKEFIFLENLIRKYTGELFTGYKVKEVAQFRVTRNSDLELDEEEAEDLLYEMEKSIKKRRWGAPVRLELEKNISGDSRQFLIDALSLDAQGIYEISGIMDLTVCFAIYNAKGLGVLRKAPLKPQPSPAFINKEVFQAIREKDILIHHPYESFDCVVDLLETAAGDPQVLAIKQTLYRVSGNSPVVNALMQAAENGKQVTVLVELKARFDEENNIIWAKKLEQSGCHVIYGLVGLKTHCKMCLIVRKEPDGIRRYVHLGTGNYNDTTAKQYTDLGYMTSKETFAQDVSMLFNLLTGYAKDMGFNKIAIAPIQLRDLFIEMIHKEVRHVQEGKEGRIVAKMNALVDVPIIQALYNASMAGVQIQLVVRGICCLKAGVPGLSENIMVGSIVDHFLEHSRIYYFENGGEPKVYLSSADWMPRNLDRRVETVFPIEEKDLKNRIIEILDIILSDTVKLRIQKPSGKYTRIDKRGKEFIHSQELFYQMAVRDYAQVMEQEKAEIFVPVSSHEENKEN